MNAKSNITGTGIAVALAVVLAMALLFFGPQLFTFINSSSTTATSTPSTTASTTTMDTSNDSTTPAAGATAAATGIPENVTELMGKDITVGTGDTATAGDTVTVNYVGSFTNGTVFDASKNHGNDGFSFKLGGGQVIKGWDQGVVGMKVGGTRELVIPASLGYGSQANGPIPANSTLVFQIELLKVQK